jgi:hypothetical protein
VNVSAPTTDIVWPLPKATTSIFELCIDAYEASVRAASDLHMNVARTASLEPVRSLAATFAGVTRDIGAAQVSIARWFLEA